MKNILCTRLLISGDQCLCPVAVVHARRLPRIFTAGLPRSGRSPGSGSASSKERQRDSGRAREPYGRRRMAGWVLSDGRMAPQVGQESRAVLQIPAINKSLMGAARPPIAFTAL